MLLLAGVAAGFAPSSSHADDEKTPAVVARDARQAELEAISHDMNVTAERQAELRREIDGLDKDRATINGNLIDTGSKIQDFEAKVNDAEKRMDGIAAQEDKIHASLLARREVLAEVLAALQRMGRRPPPAILVRPEDALSSVRSAILLGAVVPDLRGAADELADNLRQLVSLKNQMAHERDQSQADLTALAENRTRLQFLLEEKADQRDMSATELAGQEKHAADLASQATSLKDLIASIEKQISTAADAKAAADKAAADRQAANAGKTPVKPTSLGNADRLAPAVAFADAKGLLPRPVVGSIVHNFGDDDGVGGKTQGISLATGPSAQVNSPADGWVVYAGPFRSYGQLLILNAGDGYHVLLAGMERIDVQLGQFVLAGEPVATMASQKLASADAGAIGAAEPVLYIEFRKEGTSIDPAPWWATSLDEKVGG